MTTSFDGARQTAWVTMRDGVRLATDLHIPQQLPAPVVIMRTPYGRASPKLADKFARFRQHGLAVVSQDCRGTGDSEPAEWEYYVHELEDGYDLIEWVRQQPWQNGELFGCGGSYVGQTQWSMALHPAMTAIAPEVSGLGVAINTADLHMFLNAYARTVGRGAAKIAKPYAELEREMLAETLSTGVFNDPLERPIAAPLLERYPELRTAPLPRARLMLWERYCALDGAGRAEFVKVALGASEVTISQVEALRSVFGHTVAHDAHSVPYRSRAELCELIHATPLLITGWYDWGLNDALATWDLLQQHARPEVRARARLIISPGAHNAPGYHEGAEHHPELRRSYRADANAEQLLAWYDTVRGNKLDQWPRVSYYLMGANEWRSADRWPPSEARPLEFHLGPNGSLLSDRTFGPRRSASEPSRATSEPRPASAAEGFDSYCYDPSDPTPTVGGSILSSVYVPGSVDVAAVQKRPDVLTYTTETLTSDLDIVGPMTMLLFASSSAADTDFVVRLSDVFPDGRAIQLQNGILRARYRGPEPELLRPGEIYELEIDLWATANRFKAGHRLRVDISSADFPRYTRNSNTAGLWPDPIVAKQNIYRGGRYPSRLRVLAA
jgi:predicted acyl esterase